MERRLLSDSSGAGDLGTNRSRSSCFIHSHLSGYQDDSGDTRVNCPPQKNNHDATELKIQQHIPPFMSKSELSDMVLGVGELGKRFANMRIKVKVKKIMLLTKTYDKALIKHTRNLTEWLLSPEREKGYIVYIDSTFKDSPVFDVEGLLKLYPQYGSRILWWDAELCAQKPQTFDIVMTLGGDGTVLYASWLFQKVVPPVFSFSLGSLGFLTKFDFPGFEDTLSSAMKDGVLVGLRLRFEGWFIMCNHSTY